MILCELLSILNRYTKGWVTESSITASESNEALARRVVPTGEPGTVEAMKVLIPLYRSVGLKADATKLEAELKALPAKP